MPVHDGAPTHGWPHTSHHDQRPLQGQAAHLEQNSPLLTPSCSHAQPQPHRAACRLMCGPRGPRHVGGQAHTLARKAQPHPRQPLARIACGPCGPRVLGPGPHSSKEGYIWSRAGPVPPGRNARRKQPHKQRLRRLRMNQLPDSQFCRGVTLLILQRRAAIETLNPPAKHTPRLRQLHADADKWLGLHGRLGQRVAKCERRHR